MPLAVFGRIGHVAAQLLHLDVIGLLQSVGDPGNVPTRAPDCEDPGPAGKMLANMGIGSRQLFCRRLPPDAFDLMHLCGLHVEGHLAHACDVRHRSDARQERLHLLRRRGGEQ